MSELIIFVGYQASGKSTYYKQKLSHLPVVSKDLMTGNKNKKQILQLEQLLSAGKDVVLDNTNLSLEERTSPIQIAKKYGAKVTCVWFTTPFEQCLERNSQRQGKAKVPPVAMYTGRKRFNQPVKAEGFDDIIQVGPETLTIDVVLEKADKSLTKAQALLESDKPRAAIFLDKDGVIVDDSDFPYVVPKTTLLPGASDALAKLSTLGLPIIVISNQAWVAKGKMSLSEVEGIFEELKHKVGKLGGRIDGTYFCPHDTKAGCECRKPGIGMLKSAAKDFNIDLSKSTLIGDMHTDIQCGKNAGVAKTVLIADSDEKNCGPTHIFPDLLKAVDALFS